MVPPPPPPPRVSRRPRRPSSGCRWLARFAKCVLVSLLLLPRLECSSRPVVWLWAFLLFGSVGFLLVWFFRLEIVILNLSPHQFNIPIFILLLTSPYMVLLLLVHLLIWFFDFSLPPPGFSLYDLLSSCIPLYASLTSCFSLYDSSTSCASPYMVL